VFEKNWSSGGNGWRISFWWWAFYGSFWWVLVVGTLAKKQRLVASRPPWGYFRAGSYFLIKSHASHPRLAANNSAGSLSRTRQLVLIASIRLVYPFIRPLSDFLEVGSLRFSSILFDSLDLTLHIADSFASFDWVNPGGILVTRGWFHWIQSSE